MGTAYNIDTESAKIYYINDYTKKVINRIKNFIKYKDWNCLKGMVPFDKNKIPVIHSLVIDKIEESKEGKNARDKV